MGTVTVQQVEGRLAAVRCAVCKGNTFGIDQHTMQPDGEWKGVCTSCRYSFAVHTDMDFYLRTQPDMPSRLKQIPCVACEAHGVSLDFRIVMSVREAHYFVTCNKCGHQFHEQSTLETFE